MTVPARLSFLMMSSSAARSCSSVQRSTIQQVPRGLRVAEDGGQRLAQLVRERARKLAEHRDPAQVRQLPPLRAGFQLRAPPFGDVLDDAEDLVAVAADDARFEESLGVFGADGGTRPFRARPTRSRVRTPARSVSATGGGSTSLTFLVEKCRRRHVQLRLVLDVVVEDDAVGRGHEHPVGNRPQNRLDARLAVPQRLVRALLLDRDSGDIGGGLDQPQLLVARRPRLPVIHRERPEHLPLR